MSMQNETTKETAQEQGPNISADFLTGSTEIGLDRIRTRLLDLTNRNKLLNYRHSNVSSLRVVDVPMDAVFARLLDNEKIAFLPVPEPEFEGPERPTMSGLQRLRQVQIPDGHRFGLHNMRHSLSNWLVNKAKVEPKTVQIILRHSRIQSTLDIYTHCDRDETRAAQGAFLKEL